MDSDAVTREMLKQLVEKAQSEGANRIKRIVIEVGEMSGLNRNSPSSPMPQLFRRIQCERAENDLSRVQIDCLGVDQRQRTACQGDRGDLNYLPAPGPAKS
jgi:Zn finger protein HypA/HybF involved in hydrogenase expression